MHHRLAQAPVSEVVDAVLASPTEEAWSLLDARFRTTLLRLLRDGAGDVDGLASALLRAADAAPPAWEAAWGWALELIREARECRGLSEQVRFIGANERAAEVLSAVGATGVRPRAEVRDALGLSEQHLTGLLRRVEDAGLLERTRAGKEKWLQLTPRGRAMLRLITAATPADTADRAARASAPRRTWLENTPRWDRPGTFPDAVRRLQAVIS